ncbi:M81 family metallopeptidase [Actinoplanes couchii]|uniref:Microcystin degradation protein MlrC n=1 Tax=Actinoplanes couchii TaxID=403638 RepID=A0ABQ3X1P2_9ACTN|nr:M81 family metallopeptidase [Actinoplanes couchii]MDR6316834.1 microcystin degradation protein MlrC [Actinoplanes couchii]GID52441.1 microcystin degradation protein MlrC [Actinoplanes couchii]
MRIAIAGMHIESSAYAAHRAGYRDFSVLSGSAVLSRYDFLDPAAEWIGILHARSIPGGKVLREVYDDFKQRILDGLRNAGPIDGLYFDIHGAMSVDGMDDAEGDLITAIRAVIGPDVLVSAPMDLHGNVSERFARAVELPTCYRLAPHEDAGETRERAARNLVAYLASGKRPHRAWVRVPILLPGEKTSTRVEPARSLYGSLSAVEARAGVTDASIWIGYAWADEPRCHATVIVTGDSPEVVAASASELARRLWSARASFDFVGPPGTLDEAISRALASSTRPYLISDSGDNPGAGGSGDVTWVLHRLLASSDRFAGHVVYVASIFDEAAVEVLFGHRVGDAVSVTAGARVDSRVSGPVQITGVLHGLHHGDPDAGRIAVIKVGGLHVIVTEFRKAYHRTGDFSAIGLDPAAADIIITKIGYLEPTLYDIATGWTLALTPGPVDQDLERLGHHRINRPMFPFDVFPATPDLTATMLS